MEFVRPTRVEGKQMIAEKDISIFNAMESIQSLIWISIKQTLKDILDDFNQLFDQTERARYICSWTYIQSRVYFTKFQFYLFYIHAQDSGLLAIDFRIFAVSLLISPKDKYNGIKVNAMQPNKYTAKTPETVAQKRAELTETENIYWS